VSLVYGPGASRVRLYRRIRHTCLCLRDRDVEGQVSPATGTLLLGTLADGAGLVIAAFGS
jgi:hypothetical protein